MTLNLQKSAEMKLVKFNIILKKMPGMESGICVHGSIMGHLLDHQAMMNARLIQYAQSWAVLSGAGDPDRSIIAMESLNKRLVRP